MLSRLWPIAYLVLFFATVTLTSTYHPSRHASDPASSTDCPYDRIKQFDKGRDENALTQEELTQLLSEHEEWAKEHEKSWGDTIYTFKDKKADSRRLNLCNANLRNLDFSGKEGANRNLDWINFSGANLAAIIPLTSVTPPAIINLSHGGNDGRYQRSRVLQTVPG